MTKIHHNTAKKAKAHGITLEIDDHGEVVATIGSRRLASHLSGSICLEQAIAKLIPGSKSPGTAGAAPKKPARKVAVENMSDDDFDEDSEPVGDETDDVEEDENPEGASIVKRVYKTRYKPHRNTCGDSLSDQIYQHVAREDESGEMRVDATLLRQFARANDCWVPAYASLNIGQQRMNIGNRLRAKVRKGHVVAWG